MLCLSWYLSYGLQVGDKSLTAREGSLSRSMKSSFKDLCVKYEDVRNVDRMAAVQASHFTIHGFFSSQEPLHFIFPRIVTPVTRMVYVILYPTIAPSKRPHATPDLRNERLSGRKDSDVEYIYVGVI